MKKSETWYKYYSVQQQLNITFYTLYTKMKQKGTSHNFTKATTLA